MSDSLIVSAAEARKMATDGAYLDTVERAVIGSLIKTAARSKEMRVICQHEISSAVLEELKAKKYEVTHVNISNAPQYLISWKNIKE